MLINIPKCIFFYCIIGICLFFFFFFRCVKLFACVRASWSTWPSQRLWKPWRTWSLTLKTWDQVLLLNDFVFVTYFWRIFVTFWFEFKVDSVQVDRWQWFFAWKEFSVIMVEWRCFCYFFKITLFKWGYDHEKLFICYICPIQLFSLGGIVLEGRTSIYVRHFQFLVAYFSSICALLWHKLLKKFF